MDTDKKTLQQWADSAGKDIGTVVRQARRKRGQASKGDVLTASEWLSLYADSTSGDVPADVRTIVPVRKSDVPVSPTVIKGAVVRNVEPPQPLPQAQESEFSFADVRAFMRDALLIGLVVGHAGLVWYDCGRLWDAPGTIAGGLAFGLIVATLMFATDASKNLTSQWALLLALLVDAGAYWVHYPVFSQYDAPEVITRVLCVFLCAMSFGALFLFRHQKNN